MKKSTTVYTVFYLDGPKKNLCGKCGNKERESDNPSLGYQINWATGAACESGKHK